MTRERKHGKSVKKRGFSALLEKGISCRKFWHRLRVTSKASTVSVTLRACDSHSPWETSSKWLRCCRLQWSTCLLKRNVSNVCFVRLVLFMKVAQAYREGVAEDRWTVRQRDRRGWIVCILWIVVFAVDESAVPFNKSWFITFLTVAKKAPKFNLAISDHDHFQGWMLLKSHEF